MKEMNKNILLVSTNGKLTNGASQCVLMIANEMKKRGINMVVATPPGPLGEELKKNGITVEPLHQYVTMWFKYTKFTFDKKWKVLRLSYILHICIKSLFTTLQRVLQLIM